MQQSDDDFDAFALLRSGAVVHNVLLLGVNVGDDGFERLLVEHQGTRRELLGSQAHSGQSWTQRHIGRHGYVEAQRWPGPERPPVGACHFREYLEPSLRRVPELDSISDGFRGWRCSGSPFTERGFVAPPHIIPGEGGRFVPDETQLISLRVPPEFLRECARVQLTPQQLLQGFMADASGIRNYVNCPRADGFSSNGSDERDLASAWIDRSYGMNAVDLDELDVMKEEEDERQVLCDDFGELLRDFVELGGDSDELFAVTRTLISRQAALRQKRNNDPRLDSGFM